ncbi:phasin family protein [Rhodoferax sp.]|uniref:phasin family protein n=1 Tax=Rhodoferax sp. TaxID=50421 RepID=UPI0027710126|nr:phasin family protein [Rhodoferax sp.]
MVKKLTKSKPAKATGAQLSGSVRDSAQQIWQAGLGALSKAQAEGTKAIEALVKEGTTLQRKTQAAAEEKISEATSKMSNMATDITSKATGQWDKLESIFEDRVAKALNKLGVPSAKDINALVARIDELNKSVQKLSAKAASTPKVAAKTAAKPTAKAPKVADSAAKPTIKPATKRAVARKVKVVADTAQA